MYLYGFRRIGKPAAARRSQDQMQTFPTRCSPTIAVGMFLLTVLAMAMRETLGVKLGFIAVTGAITWCSSWK